MLRAPSGWAQDLGPGHTIVTVLCDYGTRYMSKLFNPAFLREKELPVPRLVGTMSLTEELFREDAYLKECDATVVSVNELGGIILDRTVFYPTGGGQPGDSGLLRTADGLRKPASRRP